MQLNQFGQRLIFLILTVYQSIFENANILNTSQHSLPMK